MSDMASRPVNDDVWCAECGFEYENLDPADIAAALRTFPKRYRIPLSRFLPGEDGDTLVRRRPAADTWSALEYAAHVRDVFENCGRWIRQTLDADRPALEGPGPEEMAVERRYNEDDPAAVAEALAANAERLAEMIESVPADGWDRVGLRRGHERTVRLTARRAVHEGGHHLLDIGRGLRAVRDQRKAAG